MMKFRKFVCSLIFTAFIFQSGSVFAQQKLKVDPSTGAIGVPAFEFPSSALASEAMSASRVNHILTRRALDGKSTDEANAALFGQWIAPSLARYPVTIEAAKIGGVPVLIYTPKSGVRPENRGRTLINLHGGGFLGCFRECGGLESIPSAVVTGIKVISIDYREGPTYQFPAASEDVAAVYAELLKTQKPDTIGLFGCSAGGVLVTQSLAWFQTHGLPMPGAVGVYCAGGSASMAGDSAIIGSVLGDGDYPRGVGQSAAPAGQPPLGYFRAANAHDPLVTPVEFPAVLIKFPPTLVISGTRDFALSSALFLHRKLTNVGNPAELYVWEGARHAFFYDPSIPEAAEVFTAEAKFFNRYLAR